MVGDCLVEIAFGPMRVGAHEVDERQLEARLAGILHELNGLAKIGDGLVRLTHALMRQRPHVVGLCELRGRLGLGINDGRAGLQGLVALLALALFPEVGADGRRLR
jgi:hypothetical protein